MTLPISVVLCSYNGSRFITEQVASILNQTYPVTELIISDDASTDDTVAVAEVLAENDKRIIIIRNIRNMGFTANFEKALQKAKHDLIAIADQDDIWHEHKIERLLKEFTPSSPLIYSDSVRFHASPPLHPVANKKNRRIEGKDPKKIAMFNTISGHAMIIRRSLLQNALPIPKGVYYDWWLALAAMCNGGVQFVPEILVFQRSHGSNVTIQNHLGETELRRRFRIMLDEHLLHFKEIKQLTEADRLFFTRLYELWHGSLIRKRNWPLFIFLWQNRQALFFYKVRKLAIFSQLKHCFLFSFRL